MNIRAAEWCVGDRGRGTCSQLEYGDPFWTVPDSLPGNLRASPGGELARGSWHWWSAGAGVAAVTSLSAFESWQRHVGLNASVLNTAPYF